MKASDEDLEIAGNMWESISGKKILVHEFDGPASIDGFRSQEIESVSEELASAKKIERLKVKYYINVHAAAGYWFDWFPQNIKCADGFSNHPPFSSNGTSLRPQILHGRSLGG